MENTGRHRKTEENTGKRKKKGECREKYRETGEKQRKTEKNTGKHRKTGEFGRKDEFGTYYGDVHDILTARSPVVRGYEQVLERPRQQAGQVQQEDRPQNS